VKEVKMNFRWKSVLGLVVLFAIFFLEACSSSSSTSSNDDELSGEIEKEISSDSKKDTSSNSKKDHSSSSEIISSSSKSLEEEFDWNVGETFVDNRDKQVYKQVVIGKQLWMAQNLNYITNESVCPQDDAGVYCDKYGRLYPGSKNNGHDVLLNDDLCPTGWVIPSETQWNTLFEYVKANNGGEGVGKSLKAKDGWPSKGTVIGMRTAVAVGKDDFRFSALPAGSRWDEGIFVHDDTRFWAWDKNNTFKTAPYFQYKMSFDSDTIEVNAFWGDGMESFSIRCINLEYSVGDYCNKSRNKTVEVVDGDSIVCDNGSWRRRNAFELLIGVCNSDIEGKTNYYRNEENGKNYYFTCASGEWRSPTREELIDFISTEQMGACTKDNQEEMLLAFFYFHDGIEDYLISQEINSMCYKGIWQEINVGTPCDTELDGKIVTIPDGPNQGFSYTCKEGRWNESTEADAVETYIISKKGECTEDNQGEKEEFFWTPYTTGVNGTVNVLCYDKKWYYSLDEISYALGAICSTKNAGTVIYAYSCNGQEWVKTTEM
jgi:uncharacterized protein (TIGR02145 family)